MIFISVVFYTSLLGIVVLFALKNWEDRHERVLIPEFRDKADAEALRLKERLVRGRAQLSKLPPAALHLSRIGVHLLALQVVRVARNLEAQAQRLADLVSHKHKFEKRDTQSVFLKHMRKYGMRPQIRNGNGKTSDGQSTEERPDSSSLDRVE